MDLFAMNSDRSNISKIIPYIQTGEVIPHEEMLEALNEATATLADERRREVASSISPEVGRYLASTDLMPFIKADISDVEARQLIAERRVHLNRLSNLLPSVLKLLAIRNEAQIHSALIQLDDCSRDYHPIKSSEYSSTQRKKIVNDLNAVASLSGELELTLKRLGYHISTDFEQHDEACRRVIKGSHTEVRLFDLLRLLGELRFSSELILYKDSIGERAFYVGDNRARTHIVEYAYRMAVQFDAPKFTTTPGSDFSTLCSLMYELATGEADESLAGAINKFGRSGERRQIDEEEIVHRHENSDEGMAAHEADNFAAVKEAIQSYETEVGCWRSMFASRKWEDFEQSQIGIRLMDAVERRDDQMNKHGPFLVWASQMASGDKRTLWDRLEENELLNLEFAAKVGRRARGERN
ncbi:hypothetical protein [Ciceribacter thiooxidans]